MGCRLKKIFSAFSGLLLAIVLAGCVGAGNSGAPMVDQSVQPTGVLRVVSVRHFSDSAGAHRVTQVEDTSSVPAKIMTFEEIVSPTKPGVDTMSLTIGSTVYHATFTTRNGVTAYVVSLNEQPPTSGTFPKEIAAVPDNQLQAALNYASTSYEARASASSNRKAPQLDALTCAVACGLTVEFEGPFALLCFGACLEIGTN
jgi:hypothetical protein